MGVKLLSRKRHLWIFAMNVLVTAGNTQTPIDRVRCITNVFTGRTGAAIALHAHDQGHHVTLLTSHPEAVLELRHDEPLAQDRWRPYRFRTFADLHKLMADEIQRGGYDAVIHCAAVSDYLAEGVYAPVAGTGFEPETGTWLGAPPRLIDRLALKVKSDEPELWLRLVRAPKLIDQIRAPWGFRGLLVKFKLEVGITDEQLLKVAEQSRQHSGADLMVANTLEEMHDWALIGAGMDRYQKVPRADLARHLLDAVESIAQLRHGQ